MRYFVAKKRDLEEGIGVVCEIPHRSLALFKVGNEFFAIDNICPHKGAFLAEGEVENHLVRCPWHAWEFNLKTGCNPDNPQLRVQSYPVILEGEEIFVEVPHEN